MGEKVKIGITKEYNVENRASLWDSASKKKNFKDKVFDGRSSYVDPLTGKVLHYDLEAAKAKYGEDAYTVHTAQVDHIVSIKEVHSVSVHNPFINDERIKDAVNSDGNYQIIAQKLNVQKKDGLSSAKVMDPDSDLTLDGRIVLTGRAIKANTVVYGKLAMYTVEGMSEEFLSGAQDTLVDSAPLLVTNAVKDMCLVATGDKDFEETIKDNAKIIVNTAVAGGGKRIIADIAKNEAKLLPGLEKFVESPEFNQMITIGVMVANSGMKFINGEIDGEEMWLEVMQTGATWVASKVGSKFGAGIGAALGSVIMPGIGTTVGYIAGQAIGYIIASVASEVMIGTMRQVLSTLHHINDYKKAESKFRRFEKAAIREMKQKRDEFEKLVKEYYGHWDATINESFDVLVQCASINAFDLLEITEKIDDILKLFGLHVRYKSVEEYEREMDKPLVLTLV